MRRESALVPGRTLTDDESECWVHYAIEPGAANAYRVCFECGHVYRTAADLEAAYLRVITEMNKSVDLSGDPEFDITEPLIGKRADDIYFCQECIHDF